MSDVTIYTRKLCGYCDAAKRLLSQKNVTFTEHDATFDPELRNQMIKLSNGAATFPQIFIDKEHVGGCDDLFALDQSGALDPMLNT